MTDWGSDIDSEFFHRAIDEAKSGDHMSACALIRELVFRLRNREAIPDTLADYFGDAFEQILRDGNKTISQALNLKKKRGGQSKASSWNWVIAVQYELLVQSIKKKEAVAGVLADYYGYRDGSTIQTIHRNLETKVKSYIEVNGAQRLITRKVYMPQDLREMINIHFPDSEHT